MQTQRFETPEEAEDAFYRAFQNRDAAAMMQVWAEDEGIVCIHPTVSRLEGPAVIGRRWQNIFEHSPEMEFTISDATRTREGNIAVHVVYEHIRLQKNERHQAPVVATNIYRLTDKGWRMILHHASSGQQAETPAQDKLH